MVSFEAEPDEIVLTLSFDGQRRSARGGGLRLIGWVDVKVRHFALRNGQFNWRTAAQGFRTLKPSTNLFERVVEGLTGETSWKWGIKLYISGKLYWNEMQPKHEELRECLKLKRP
ncbi:MAG: hypothetical protein ACEY26_00455 [Candidatus Hodgkinia cicadicola]